MSLVPPPIRTPIDTGAGMNPVWIRWFVDLFKNVGGSQGLDSGFYTPTLTPGDNVQSAESARCYWMRLKNTIVVSGSVTADPIHAAAVTRVGLALPVAPAFVATTQCAGAGGSSGTVGATQVAEVFADVANQRATLQWVSGGIGSQRVSFSFAYEVAS